MTRLLFAAARGARIQSEYHNWGNGGREWRDATLDNLAGARIHPDDEHLQYGPVSTALRNSVLGLPIDPRFNSGNLMQHFMSWGWSFGEKSEGDWDTQKATYKLILAEALADEGL